MSFMYLRFHPVVLHLVDEFICHLQGNLLLLSVCSVTWQLINAISSKCVRKPYCIHMRIHAYIKNRINRLKYKRIKVKC